MRPLQPEFVDTQAPRPECSCDGGEDRPVWIVVPSTGVMQCEWCIEDLRPPGSYLGCRLYLLEEGSQTASREVMEPPQEAWSPEPLPHRIDRPELLVRSETSESPVETPSNGRVFCHPGGSVFSRLALVQICRPEGEEFEDPDLVPPHTPEEIGGGGGGGGAGEQCSCECVCYPLGRGVPPLIREGDDVEDAGVVLRPPPRNGEAVVAGLPQVPPIFPPSPPRPEPPVVAAPPGLPPHTLPLPRQPWLAPLHSMGPDTLLVGWPDAVQVPSALQRHPVAVQPADARVRAEHEERGRLGLMPPAHPAESQGEPDFRLQRPTEGASP